MIIKHAEAQGLLKQAQDTIKQLVADNDALRAQCDQLLLEKRASGLAHVMADRGLLGQYTIEKMASGLAARPDQLDVVEKALQFNLSDAFAAGSSISVWNAATMGLVISLAKPHSANSEVMAMKGRRYFFSTSFIDSSLRSE